MRKLLPLLALAAATLPSACDLDPCGRDAEAFAARAEDFFAEVAAADYDASDAAWGPYDERLAELVETCYPEHEDALTRAQDRAFWAGVTRYYTQRYGRAGAREFLRKLKGGIGERLRKAADAIEQ